MRFTFHAVVFNPVWNNQRESKKQETGTNEVPCLLFFLLIMPFFVRQGFILYGISYRIAEENNCKVIG